MSYVVINGEKRRIRGAYVGTRKVTHIYKGDELFWPSGKIARRIVVELPEEGTIEWAYWQHCMRSLEENPVGNNNFMRFSVDNIKYYISKSPDGTPPYQIEGNTIFLEFEESDGVPVDMLREYLPVYAVTGRRTEELEFSLRGENKLTYDLPYITGTQLRLDVAKQRKKDTAGARGTIVANGTGQELAGFVYETAVHRRGWLGIGPVDMQKSLVNAGNKYIKGTASMTELCYGMDITVTNTTVGYQAGDRSKLTLTFPAISRQFNLKILSYE